MSREKASAFASVKDVLENGIVVMPMGYHGIHGKKQATGMIAAPIEMNGESRICIVEVIQNTSDRRLYVHEVFNTKKIP